MKTKDKKMRPCISSYLSLKEELQSETILKEAKQEYIKITFFFALLYKRFCLKEISPQSLMLVAEYKVLVN